MLLTKRRTGRSHILVYFVFIIVICQLSKARDYQCKPDEVQFECKKDGRCIPKQWECDGESDCTDNSDEMKCGLCDHNKFSCDKKCISKQWLCDGHNDCSDGSDEAPKLCANKSCDANEIRCVKSKKCISKNWVCDHEMDCEDGSDEVNCTVKPCPIQKFQCNNNACIDLNWKCDHDYDCEDQSDEVNCTYSQCDNKWDFQCKDSRCIQKEAFCDNQYDCKDKSDEPAGCTSTVPHKSKCPADRFNCKDGSCISRSWVCDGDSDCSSGDDEKQSCQHLYITCRDDQMKCKIGKKCVSKSSKCDGKPDCEDGSDENGCETASSKCKEGEFECAESKLCISESLVCNGHKDCVNGTDESNLCGKNECEDNKGGCDHQCSDEKIGYRCLCDAGYELANDNKTCKDINECQEFGKCSQNCVNIGGGYKCSCVAGYLLDKKDRRTCKAIERHPYLVFSDNYSIRKLMLHKSQFFGIVSNLAGTIAVDYHFGENLVYWTDMKNFSIYRTTLHGNKTKPTKIVTDVRAPDGIAVDWVTGKLYWTDAWAKRIEVSDLLGRNRTALIKTDIDMPRAIVLHPYRGEMFWTDWGTKPKIERCGMDGDPTSRKAIITSRIVWPNALTIDYTINRIWWVDAKLDVIEHCDLNGGKRRVILAQDKIFHPFSISVFEDHVYWSDWSKTAIFKANKFTGKDVTVLKQGLVHTLGINMIHPQRQPASFNFCQEYNGGCSHLCLLSARHKKKHLHSCACPEGINMLADKRTCNTTDALLCVKGRCNNGTCLPGNGARGPVCLCNEGYTSHRCERQLFELPTKAQNDNSNANAITIGISVGVVALIFIIFGIVGYVFYKKIQKRYNPQSLPFDNPIYTKTTERIEAGGSLLPFTLRKPLQGPFANDPEPLDL